MAKVEITVSVDEERLKELKAKLNELKRLIPINIHIVKTSKGSGKAQ